MYCYKCGNKLRDDAKFCDECGARISKSNDYFDNTTNSDTKDGKNFKCSACGELLSFDTIICPSCGKDVRNREVVSSVKTFVIKLNQIEDEDKKINMIKTFIVPNDRESIFELMLLSTSNLDVKYYATNRKKDSLASAWYTKIQQCYDKGKLLFTNEQDINKLNLMYKKVQDEINSIVTRRKIMIVSGLLFILVPTIIVSILIYNGVKNGDKTFSFYAFMSMGYIVLLFIGFILIKFGLSRKKTDEEIELIRQRKAERKDSHEKTIEFIFSHWKVILGSILIIVGGIMAAIGYGFGVGSDNNGLMAIGIIGLIVFMLGVLLALDAHNENKSDRED